MQIKNTKSSVLSFTHNIHYYNNIFQSITLHLTTDLFTATLNGTYSIKHSNDAAYPPFTTPAAVFSALYEKILSKEKLTFNLDEPDNYSSELKIVGEKDTFTFLCREFHLQNKE